MAIVYRITNMVNGKCYVGQTWHSLSVRVKGHVADAFSSKRRGCTAIHAAIRKYGISSFTWEILEEASTQKALDWLESDYIEELGTMSPNGYNLTTGGLGGRKSEETKERCREANKKQFSSIEARKQHSEIARKYFQEHPEARERISSQFKGKKRNPDAVKKMIETITGRKLSQETKAKISSKATGRKHTTETKKKISEASKRQTNRVPPPLATGLKRSEETKKRMSEAQLRNSRWRDWESCCI